MVQKILVSTDPVDMNRGHRASVREWMTWQTWGWLRKQRLCWADCEDFLHSVIFLFYFSLKTWGYLKLVSAWMCILKTGHQVPLRREHPSRKNHDYTPTANRRAWFFCYVRVRKRTYSWLLPSKFYSIRTKDAGPKESSLSVPSYWVVAHKGEEMKLWINNNKQTYKQMCSEII